jgi:hypothetical protein
MNEPDHKDGARLVDPDRIAEVDQVLDSRCYCLAVVIDLKCGEELSPSTVTTLGQQAPE